jgi:FtsH-binding integral membrane protein
VFVLPRLRLEWTPIDGPPPLALIAGLAPLALLVYRRFSAQRLRRPDVFLIAIIELGLVGASAFSLELTAALWNMVRMAAPLVVVASAILLSGRGFTEAWSVDAQRLFVAASIAAWCALIQFPTDSYQYFLYVLPLAMLSAGFLASERQTPSRAVAGATLAAFGGLALLSRPVFIHGGGSHAVLMSEPRAVLDLRRGGLTIRRDERDEYVSLVALIQAHSKGRYIYASPDSPEVYFLAERENPTRTLFDFFDDPHDRTARVMAALRAADADVAVINTAPRFSDKLPSDLSDSLAARFRSSARVGLFEVRW